MCHIEQNGNIMYRGVEIWMSKWDGKISTEEEIKTELTSTGYVYRV